MSITIKLKWILVYTNYFSSIVSEALSLLKHPRIRSWIQPVLSNEYIKFLAHGNNGWVRTHRVSNPKITTTDIDKYTAA
jgi:hypothetical protein